MKLTDIYRFTPKLTTLPAAYHLIPDLACYFTALIPFNRFHKAPQWLT